MIALAGFQAAKIQDGFEKIGVQIDGGFKGNASLIKHRQIAIGRAEIVEGVFISDIQL